MKEFGWLIPSDILFPLEFMSTCDLVNSSWVGNWYTRLEKEGSVDGNEVVGGSSWLF